MRAATVEESVVFFCSYLLFYSVPLANLTPVCPL